ncbi:MAG TPA: RNA 2',3'-cyclic phosphodiesterase [Methanocorpusculum sp.]|nr:RNA 2',3'-cyclic phosphodiesterase [Methanocorpusculum sp.]
MVRAFIAVELPSELREKIAVAGSSLKGAGKIMPVAPHNMHITLKFLGEISEKEIETVKSELAKIKGAPYTVKAAKVSAFGRPPRVIKAEIADEGKCALLASQIENLLAAKGFAREEKKFTPHITIARVKEYSPALTPKINAVRETEFGECTIDKIVLKQSTLTPSGPVYKTLFEVPL